MASGTLGLQDKGQAVCATRAPGSRRPSLATSQASSGAGTGGQSKGNCSHLNVGAWDPEAPRSGRTLTASPPGRPPVRGLSTGGEAQLEPTSRVPTHHSFQNTMQLHKMLLLYAFKRV